MLVILSWIDFLRLACRVSTIIYISVTIKVLNIVSIIFMDSAISIISSVFKDIFNFFWPLSVRSKLIRFIVLLGAVTAAVVFLTQNNTPVAEPITVLPQVQVGTVASVLNTSGSSFIGTLRSISEAQIQSEIGGRVTSVQAEAGSAVRAGSIIATLENAGERASVLQAQGSYEAALAGAAQGGVGINEAQNAVTAAENGAVTTYKNAYTTVSSVVFTSLDQFYANPNSQVPGVRISDANTSLQNAERVKLNATLPAWQTKILSLNTQSDLKAALSEAEATTKQVLVLVDDFIRAFNKAQPNNQYTEQDYRDLVTQFSGVRAQLVGVLASIDGARTGLASAKENAARAAISGSGSTVSSADAQVKIALGSLRAAQANLEKTILRSPISGTVDVLRVKTGDYIGAFTPVAQVSSKGGLEVSLFVGEQDLPLFEVGKEVQVNGSATGTVVNIAPAIDPLTFKTEVKIAIPEDSSLTTGGTVTVSLNSGSTATDGRLLVPITAVKFNDKDGFVFKVEDGKLKAMPVVIGPIVGSLVTIVSGIDRDTQFVLDGRGRAEGQQVEVTQ
jgi:HlyD family secretion protein